MTPIDWLVIAAYFAVLLSVAWWVILKGKDTADDYFLAGRHLGWFIVGASIFASNIGSEHLVGLAGSGATDGVAMAHYELHAWCLLVLGWVFVPFYTRSKVFTMPEFLEKRFSPNARWMLSIISLVAYVVTKIAVGIFAGGIVFSVLLPELKLGPLDSFWIGSLLVLLVTGLYTALGGFRAVAYTEALQTIILVVGSALVTWYGLQALGGWGELRQIAGSDMFNLWKPLVPAGVEGTWAPVEEVNAEGDLVRQAWYFNGNYPWLGMLFCAPIIGLWYWCTDQYIVQRALGAPNEKEARRGSIFAGMLKLLPVFIFIIPGIICFALLAKAQSGGASDKQYNFQKMLVVDKYLDHEPLVKKYREYTTQETRPVDGKREEVPKEVTVISLSKIMADKQRYQALLNDIDAIRGQRLMEAFPQHVGTKDGVRRVLIDEMSDKEREDYRKMVKAEIADSGMSFPMMVTNVLPSGIRGIVVAGLLAALMSSLAGVFNASATLFTMDFYSRLRPHVTQHDLVRIGRIATAVMILIGIAWIPVIKGSKGLYDYLQSVQGYLAPPIFVVFFLGVFWKRLNAAGCVWALIVGFAMGVFRMLVDTPPKVFSGFEYAEGSFLWILNKIYFQYYSLLVFLVSCVVMIVVSFVTKPPDDEKLSGLTYGTISDAHRQESRSSWNWLDVAVSGLVLVAILAAYLYFRG